MRPRSMPEPDILVIREEPTTGPVRGETVALIVEVADTTVKFDLGKKARTYARHGITEYWVADLTGGAMHQHWAPSAGGSVEKRELRSAGGSRRRRLPGWQRRRRG